MLLSIVMMMRNEEKYLDKTLKSLKALTDYIKSEIVILDTGSNDKSIDIAKKYTNKVYFSKWNNNFADMRNESIRYAKGDWILILDADEELVDCNKLIEFFKSDLHLKYNCASIELINIFSEDKSSYNKSSNLRLFKNSEEFRYIGAIHEQPIYQKPIYNDIASFNHYGYMFIDEEIKQRKLNRNEKILLSELEKNPNDAYVNYQLAKNYMVHGDNEEAMYYMKTSFDLFKITKLIPAYVNEGLAKLYLNLSKYKQCESICLNYIKNDDKNIDIYYYLALSQKQMGKYENSLKNYERYIYLIENYELSSQSNSIFCDGNTVGLKENVQIEIVNIYYKLEMYETVLSKVKELKDEQLKKVYLIVFISLYKLNREKEILDIYNGISNSEVDKKEFKINLESMMLNVKQSDRSKIYNVLANINDNYGVLNEVRLGKKLSTKEYNEIITKEKEMYYSDLIYYAFKQGIDLINVLRGTSKVYIQKYFNYMINYRKNCVLDIYNYLIKQSNTLDLNKLGIYSSLSKALLLNGNLKNEKYENLFLMYIAYSYNYLRVVYNTDLKDEELLKIVKDEEDIFIISIVSIQKLKKFDELEYVKKMREILIDNNHHKDGIEILIDKFKKEFNECEELKNLKYEYKLMIKNDINAGNLIEAKNKISQYEEMFNEETEILNIKSIISLLENDFYEAEKLLKKAWIIDLDNYDVIFNIGYIKELLGEKEEAIKFYNKILSDCQDKNIVLEVKEKINLMAQNKNCMKGVYQYGDY